MTSDVFTIDVSLNKTFSNKIDLKNLFFNNLELKQIINTNCQIKRLFILFKIDVVVDEKEHNQFLKIIQSKKFS